MCGVVDIPVDHMEILNDQCRIPYLNQPLIGSHTIWLPSLDYLHFILDVDLKQVSVPVSYRRLSTFEYCQYSLNPTSVDTVGNLLVYILAHILVNTLGVTSFPIYILGKGGTLAKGFHIEVPDLMLPYYDHTMLTDACRSIFPKFVDGVSTYSIFGSQTYTTCMIVEGQKYQELI